MFILPHDHKPDQIITCLLDKESCREIEGFGSTRHRVWTVFVNFLVKYLPCLTPYLHRQAIKNRTLMETGLAELQTDLNRSWVLFINGTRCRNRNDFLNAVSLFSEVQKYNMLILSYQKAWGIFMSSLLEVNKESGDKYRVAPGCFQSIRWNIAGDGKIHLVAKCTFPLMQMQDKGREGEAKTVSFTFQHLVGEKTLNYSYKAEMKKTVCLEACTPILRLEERVSLREVMEIFHPINVAWGTDFRKVVIERYNQVARQPLPSEWDGAPLDQVYDLDVSAFYEAFCEEVNRV